MTDYDYLDGQPRKLLKGECFSEPFNNLLTV